MSISLQAMPTVDPLQLARQLVRLELVNEAIATLEKARLTHPDRTDLRDMLEELHFMRSNTGLAWITFHVMMFYVLNIAVWAVVFVPFIQLGIALSAGQPPNAPIPLWEILVCLVIFILLIYVQQYLVLRVWFVYLRRFTGSKAHLVEKQIRTDAFGDYYGIVRQRYFPGE